MRMDNGGQLSHRIAVSANPVPNRPTSIGTGDSARSPLVCVLFPRQPSSYSESSVSRFFPRSWQVILSYQDPTVVIASGSDRRGTRVCGGGACFWRWRRWQRRRRQRRQSCGARQLVWALPSAVAFCWAPSRSPRAVGGGWQAGTEAQSIRHRFERSLIGKMQGGGGGRRVGGARGRSNH